MNDIIQLSSKKFLAGCFVAAVAILFVGMTRPFSPIFIGAEVLLTIVALFVFGSIRYQLDKNALTYGAVMIIAATFFTVWWPQSELNWNIQQDGFSALLHFVYHNFLTLHGLNELIHADTMLFILGLTFFVAAIAQTRLLESLSFVVLERNKGAVLPTVAFLTAVVAFSSGILDGVSMIGLMIRTLVIILIMAKADNKTIKFAVIISTIVTTVCGMWLAYGEPPNLIMKANLHPHLTNSFFLKYCLPIAIGSYLIVFLNLRKYLKGQRVATDKLDVLDHHTADIRFMQAEKHGKVLSSVELIDEQKDVLGDLFSPVMKHLHAGRPLGEALVVENVPKQTRLAILETYTTKDLSEVLDDHYHEGLKKSGGHDEGNLKRIVASMERERTKRIQAQRIGIASFVPFVGLLILHGINHNVPLFLASFAGFLVAFFGIVHYKKIRSLVLHEATHEYKEYLFLFPLFLSITLLQKSGFFSVLIDLLHQGIETLGVASVAAIQYSGAVFLSALLDNNVVADFASRALHGLDVGVIHMFSMAQIAGYAVGGCWTHIGSAQSVVAYAYIKKDVDSKFSPFSWIKWMTPVILEISILFFVVIYGKALILHG